MTIFILTRLETLWENRVW